MRRAWLAAVILLPCAVPALASVTLQTQRFTATLNDDASWQSLVDHSSGRECLPDGVKLPVAVVRHGGKSYNALAVAAEGDRLRVTFANTDTVLTYAVQQAADWVVFRLEAVAGTRPESLILLQIPVSITQNVGPRLNCAWDEQTAVCIMAATRQADCGARAGGFATLMASTQDAPGPVIEGTAAALIVCPTPVFKTVAREASHAFGLLANETADGIPAKDIDATRGSYWFLSFGEQDVERVIDYCQRSGIRQVMMGFGSWAATAGHYLFNQHNYPHGQEGLKTVVDRLHAADILVGMHTFVSKVSKTDPYVTPIPDKRFWKDMQTTLAEDITAEQTEIRAAGDLSQWPGSPVCKQKTWEGGVDKHREVIIGDEIIQYESIGPEGRWDTFRGCKRGAWGTAAAPHAASDTAYHFGVDGCINGYIIDQETSLMDEVAERIAGIFNDCGFDMVYFDGGEDVDRRRFNYYVSNFQEQAMRRFARRPLLHMGTIMTHLLWHSFARSSTVDTYLSTLYGAIIAGAPPDKWPTVREHIDRSVSYLLSVRQDMMPGELGWFGIWPRGPNTDGLQLDEVEYLMCKSLGYDAPISLQTSFDQMEAHPLTSGILEIVREYEALRMSRAVPEEARAPLRELQKDFALVRWQGQTHFVPVQEVPLVGGTHDVRALVGDLEGGSVATLWHYLRDGQVLLPLDPARLHLVTLTGEAIPFQVEEGKAVIPVGNRRWALICQGISAAELRVALETAQVRLRPATRLFIRASSFTRLEGQMVLGAQVGITEPEAFGDVLLCTGQPSSATPREWFAEYTVDVPREGVWYLWARVRYPSGADDSFGLVLPDEPVTLQGRQVLGNCGVNDKQWHWTGQGFGVSSVPPGQAIRLRLNEGPFTFRIYAREGPGTAELNPRLDLLCLTDEPDAPTDEQAREGLGQ